MTQFRWLWKGPVWLMSAAMILCVRGYQKFGRPLLPPMCRYEPGCSEYFVLAVKKYGPVRGASAGATRGRRAATTHPEAWV